MKHVVHSRSRAGVTLVELMIAVSIMALVLSAALPTIRSGTESSRTVTTGVAENSASREAGKRISQELRSAGGGRFEIVPLADGNHELTFQVPVTAGGVDGSGVYDRRLGGTEDDWSRLGWSLRYTVVPGNDGQRLLVRQVLDELDEVQRQTTLVTDLRAGDVDPPGFRVVDQGEVWEVVIATESTRAIGGESGGMRLHVRTRN